MRSLLRTGLFLLPLLAAGCDHIEYHPYDTDISGEQNINAKNIARIEAACRGRQTVRFAMISDTQRWYDETEKAVEALNARDDIDFVLHGGDLSDFGLKKEFMWQRDILNRLRVPYVCLLGNHDCQGTGEAVFEKIFGPSDFAFTAADVRFVCLNTNAMEYDYSHPVPDFDFLEHEYGSFAPPARRTIFAMHVRPYDFQFNNNVAKVFEHYVMRFPQPLCCIFGHEHRWIEEDIFGDGMKGFASSGPEESRHINRWLSGNCFGDYYTRTGLDYRQREMITFCFIAAQGGCEPQLISHAAGNMKVGNDKAFLIKIISQCLPYIGYPRSLNALRCVNDAAAQQGE